MIMTADIVNVTLCDAMKGILVSGGTSLRPRNMLSR